MSPSKTFRISPSRRTLRRIAMCGAVLLCSALSAPAQSSPAADPLTRLYEYEIDVVRKARAFPKYGEALFVQIRKDVDSGHYPAALSKLENYITRARTMRLDLKAVVPDPERRANGFKQLQIHIRKSVRTLDHTIVAIPLAERPPFVAGRRDIEAIDKDLISDLFPRQPGRKDPDPKKEKP